MNQLRTKKFDKCPTCGSVNRTGEILSREEQEKGNLSKDELIPVFGFAVAITNPNKQSKLILSRRAVPVLQAVCDICDDCGTLYVTQYAVQDGVLQAEPTQPGQQIRK